MAINPWTSNTQERDDSGRQRLKEDKESSSNDSRDTSSSHRSYAEQFHSSGNVTYGGTEHSSREAGEGSFRDKYLQKNSGRSRAWNDDETEDKMHAPTDEPETAVPDDKVSRELLGKLEEVRRTTSHDDLPALSKNARKQLGGSFRELSLIEGNLRGIDRNLQVIYCTSCFEKEGKTTASSL